MEERYSSSGRCGCCCCCARWGHRQLEGDDGEDEEEVTFETRAEASLAKAGNEMPLVPEEEEAAAAVGGELVFSEEPTPFFG